MDQLTSKESRMLTSRRTAEATEELEILTLAPWAALQHSRLVFFIDCPLGFVDV